MSTRPQDFDRARAIMESEISMVRQNKALDSRGPKYRILTAEFSIGQMTCHEEVRLTRSEERQARNALHELRDTGLIHGLYFGPRRQPVDHSTFMTMLKGATLIAKETVQG